MNNIIQNRKKVYLNLPKTNLRNNISNIVLSYNINNEKYLELTKEVQNFLCKCMSLVYKKEFIWNDTFLEDNDKLIMSLPNKTPNGVLNPKKETSHEFSNIQNILNGILDDLHLFPHIKKLLPFNIRYKNNDEESWIKKRPYYTSKYHSDAWVGHVGDSQFLIGVLGDLKNNTVEFNEPINVHDNYLDKADSFEQGNTRYKDFKYLGCLPKQTVTIMDHACLHRTLIQKGAKPRISIDIAVMIDSKYSHYYSQQFKQMRYKYLEPLLVNSIGKSKKYNIPESIFEDIKDTTLNIN